MGGRRRRGRQVDGILLLDKPKGQSSNRALQSAKHIFKAQKAGHTGSLDPLASGLLPVCFGKATKVSAFLLDADKHYVCTAQWGVKTATGDAEGEVVERSPTPVAQAGAIEKSLAAFRGELQQIPPMYSAVKHKGRRLYELAREGIEVEREPRPIRVDAFDLLDTNDGQLDFRVHCSKGTYVRTLIEDWAESMGGCAHITGLRRLAVGPFRQGPFYTLEDLEQVALQGLEWLDNLLLPIDAALAEWPAVTLDADSSFYMRQGQAVQVPRAPTQGQVLVYDENARLLAVGEILDDGRVAPRRMLRV